MEDPSWKHQLAVASFVAILGGLVLRFLIPDYFFIPGLAPDRGGAFGIGLFAVLFVFFLPYVWRGTVVGYGGAIILSIIVLIGNTVETVGIAGAGELSLGVSFVVIPTYIFALLLIGISVLAWREG